MQSVAQNGAKPPPKPTPAPSRMTLGNIVTGRVAKPIRAMLYGVEGIGKSTFAANAPKPIFLGTEDGTSELDVARFPEPGTWTEGLDAIQELTTTDHDYKTLAIDTLDWLEPLCWKAVCIKGGWSSIEDAGYGKGYVAALDEWRIMLARLDRLRQVKKMHVVLLAHSWIKPFKNPEGDDFDRYELKLHAKTGGLLKEWCDVVMFANYETFTKKKSEKDRAKGVDAGARVMHSQRRAAWDAKNRYDLPETMPLDWELFAESVAAHKPGEPAFYRARISQLLPNFDEAISAKVEASVTAAGNDAAELARIADKLSGMIQTQEIAQ
jgi:hypothetical protein